MLKKLTVLCLLLLTWTCVSCRPNPAKAKPSALQAPILEIKEFPNATAYIYKVPANRGYTVMPLVSPGLQVVKTLAEQQAPTALAAVNAGYFDPVNKKTTSYVEINGITEANPPENERFMGNPALQPYIPKMLNRSELRALNCNGEQRYQIALHQDPTDKGCQIVSRIQAGPNLFVENSLESEGFVAYLNGELVRDPMGVNTPNARVAVGVLPDQTVLLVMVAMKPGQSKSGFTLAEVTQLLKDLGAAQAINFDGGSSSTLWTPDKTWYGKLGKGDNPIMRSVKTALVVIPPSQQEKRTNTDHEHPPQ